MKPLIPAAISSQLDDTGEERIHIAPIVELNRPVYEGGGSCVLAEATEGTESDIFITNPEVIPIEAGGSSVLIYDDNTGTNIANGILSSDRTVITELTYDQPLVEGFYDYYAIEYTNEGGITGELCLHLTVLGAG